jgi:hypothetical protein
MYKVSENDKSSSRVTKVQHVVLDMLSNIGAISTRLNTGDRVDYRSSGMQKSRI